MSSVMIPPTRQGGVLRQREGGVETRSDSQDVGAVFRPHVRKTGRKLRRRIWASAGQNHRAKRRWRNIIDSIGRSRSADLVRGGGVCQPSFACTNGVADGRICFFEQLFPYPPAGAASLGIICPETDAPHGVKRAGFSQTLGASAQKVSFMPGFCENLALVPARTASSRTPSEIALSKLRTLGPIRLCARARSEDVIISSRRSRKRRAFSSIIKCSAQEPDTSPRLTTRGTTAKIRR